MFRVFGEACKDLSNDALAKFLPQSIGIWHKKDRPIKHLEMTAQSFKENENHLKYLKSCR